MLFSRHVFELTIIATGRNRAFRLSGNSVLPAYPGFIVVNIAQVRSNFNSVSSNISVFFPACIARWIVSICCATTDRTSRSIRLNSSKQDHAPVLANPCGIIWCKFRMKKIYICYINDRQSYLYNKWKVFVFILLERKKYILKFSLIYDCFYVFVRRLNVSNLYFEKFAQSDIV